jgi:hypothetical protein
VPPPSRSSSFAPSSPFVVASTHHSQTSNSHFQCLTVLPHWDPWRVSVFFSSKPICEAVPPPCSSHLCCRFPLPCALRAPAHLPPSLFVLRRTLCIFPHVPYTCIAMYLIVQQCLSFSLRPPCSRSAVQRRSLFQVQTTIHSNRFTDLSVHPFLEYPQPMGGHPPKTNRSLLATRSPSVQTVPPAP